MNVNFKPEADAAQVLDEKKKIVVKLSELEGMPADNGCLFIHLLFFYC